MKKVLKQKFFARPAPVVAQDLLGKFLVRKIENEECAYMITEVEAYEGTEDLASHASKGKTKRTEIMFGKAGRLYVYLIYGMYSMLNVVTHEECHPSAVLIRGVEEISGPGRLTQALFLDRTFNGLAAEPKNGVWFEDRNVKIPELQIQKTPRIGVDYAGPIWAKKEWRFVLKNFKGGYQGQS